RPRSVKPQAGDENKKGSVEQFPGIKPEPQDTPVDVSLVENDSGGIQTTTANHKKSAPDKNMAHSKQSWKEKFFSRGLEVWPHTNKQKKISIAIIGLLLIFGSVTTYALNKILKRPLEVSSSVIIQKPKSTVPSRLTGVEISKELNKRHVTSIMIENSPDA